MRKPPLILAAVLVSLALIAAGCGGDDDDGGGGGGGGSTDSSGAQGNGADTGEAAGGGGGKLKLVADPGGGLKFDKTQLSAKPGKVTITMDNQSNVPHAVEVEGNGVEEETKTVTGGSADLAVDLKAGKYEFYCPVDGHRQAGMEGTLTVG